MFRIENGAATFICPECLSIIKVEGLQEIPEVTAIGNFHRYDDFTFEYCPSCKVNNDYDIFHVDEKFAKIVVKFNRKGYITESCCAGHGWDSPYIYLAFHAPRKLYDLQSELYSSDYIKIYDKDSLIVNFETLCRTQVHDTFRIGNGPFPNLSKIKAVFNTFEEYQEQVLNKIDRFVDNLPDFRGYHVNEPINMVVIQAYKVPKTSEIYQKDTGRKVLAIVDASSLSYIDNVSRVLTAMTKTIIIGTFLNKDIDQNRFILFVPDYVDVSSDNFKIFRDREMFEKQFKAVYSGGQHPWLTLVKNYTELENESYDKN